MVFNNCFNSFICIFINFLFYWKNLSLDNFLETLVIMVLFVIYGFIFSIPTVIGLGYLYRYLSKKKIGVSKLNLWLCLFSIICVFTTFYFFDKKFLLTSNIMQLMYPFCYSLIASILIIFIRK